MKIRVKDTESFIKKAKIVHGDVYDYRETVYQKANKNVKIICKEHGPFMKQASHHVNSGSGCPDCARISMIKKLSKTTEDFIKDARDVHGDKYDYSHVQYENNLRKVEIKCYEHGIFLQSYSAHVTQGSGCPSCYNKVRSSRISKDTSYFIERARKVYGNKYDYSKTEYKSAREKVVVICPDHGEFSVAPNHHISSGSACSICHREATWEKETMSMINESIIVHDDKYDYSKVEISPSGEKVTIICPVHGEFKQVLYNHSKGSGCAKCNCGGYRGNPNSAYGIAGYYGTGNPSNIYIMKIFKDTIKVGVAKDIDSRKNFLERQIKNSVDIVSTWAAPANKLFEIEQGILHKSGIPKKELDISFTGSTECFDIMHLDAVIYEITKNLDS